MRRAGRIGAKLTRLLVLSAAIFLLLACGPVPAPDNAYKNGRDLLGDMERLRAKVRGFRITGRIEHRGDDGVMKGKVYLFAALPDLLRIELISPFNTPMSVLTANRERFALHDLRNGRYVTGPPLPCNLARLIEVPLSPQDVARILVGRTPIIPGDPGVSWSRDGFYRVEIASGNLVQQLTVGPGRSELPLLRSRLKDRGGTIFEITYDRWFDTGGIAMPHEIRIEMPRHRADLTVRYNPNGVELNVALPDGAFDQSPPDGVRVEAVTCD